MSLPYVVGDGNESRSEKAFLSIVREKEEAGKFTPDGEFLQGLISHAHNENSNTTTTNTYIRGYLPKPARRTSEILARSVDTGRATDSAKTYYTQSVTPLSCTH